MKLFRPIAISGASQLTSIVVVVWLYRTPSKLFVIAAIVKCRSTNRRGYNREVGLVNGPEELKFELRREWNDRKKKTHPSLRHEATKTASASASFSINHSPGRSGLPGAPFAIFPFTAFPSTLITTSCALELTPFARLMSAISSESLINRVCWSALRR